MTTSGARLSLFTKRTLVEIIYKFDYLLIPRRITYEWKLIQLKMYTSLRSLSIPQSNYDYTSRCTFSILISHTVIDDYDERREMNDILNFT